MIRKFFIIFLLGFGLISVSAFGQRVNLAKYQSASADSSWDSSQEPVYITDGIVGNSNRWSSKSGGPHWAKIDFPYKLVFGSAHIYCSGKDQNNILSNFKLQYSNGSSWADIPGANFTANTKMELNVIFDTPVESDSIRLYSTDNVVGLKELALYPPNGGTGFPLGTDVTINLAKDRLCWADSTNSTNKPLKAFDGFVANNSRWLSANTNGPHKLTVDLQFTSLIASAHIYMGAGDDPNTTIKNFTLKYLDASGSWRDIPGASVTNNDKLEVRLDFTSPVTTSQVLLYTPDNGYARVKEFLIFPANQGKGYPLGTNVEISSRPTKNFKDYGDDYYSIDTKVKDLSIESSDSVAYLAQSVPERRQQYQILYQIGTNCYRIRNRMSGKSLEVTQASKQEGALIREADFAALPNQLWLLNKKEDYFEIENLWSGLVLDVDGDGTAPGQLLIQRIGNNSDTQQWKIDYVTNYPKIGIAGYQGTANKYGFGWTYEWSLGTSKTFSPETNFAAMVWGNYGWDKVRKKASQWKTRAKQLFLMGFNEPDHKDQSNISVSKAIDAWPKMMQANVPLLSPAPANPWSWAPSFMGKVANKGYRCEYFGVHWYGAPSASGFMDNLWNLHNKYGKPLWVTEFSNVDWGGKGKWTYSDDYEFFAVVLWRMENSKYIKRYSVFPFSGGTGGKRSNFFNKGSLTPIGRIYCAWDGDTTIRNRKAYFLFNKSTEKKLRNLSTGIPKAGDISVFNTTVQWYFLPADNDLYYVISVADGGRLSYDGSNIEIVPAGTTGPDVQWKRASQNHGWFFLQHPATEQRLRYNNGVFEMVDKSNTWDSLKWRVIKPLEPGSIQQYYIIHKASGKKLHLSSSGGVNLENVTSKADDVKWTITDMVNSSYLHIDNVAAGYDARRLNDNSQSGVDLEDTKWTGEHVRWKLVDAGDGWYRLENAASGKWLNSGNGQSVNQAATTNTGDGTKWKLVDCDSYYIVHKTSHNRLHFKDLGRVNLVSPRQSGDDVSWHIYHPNDTCVYFDNLGAPYYTERLYAEAAENFEINLSDSKWIGDNVKWKLVDAGDGWYRLRHQSSGNWLHSADGNNLDLISLTDSSDDTKWRLVNLDMPNIQPEADAGNDQNVYAWIDGKADITLDGSGSVDYDDDHLQYLWSWTIGRDTLNADGINPEIELPVGIHQIELVVDDGHELSEPNYCTINVIEALSVKFYLIPNIVNPHNYRRQILVLFVMPDGMAKSEIDMSKKLKLYPGAVPARRQFAYEFNRLGQPQSYILALFDRNACLDNLSAGYNAVQVTGKLNTGCYYYGSGNLMVISSGK